MAPITRPRLIQDRPSQRGASLRKNDPANARTYSERVEAGGSAHDGVMQRTLYNHVIPPIMAQSRVESHQRCVTIIGCVHDHNCGTIRSCVTIKSCVTLTNCVFVDLNREVIRNRAESLSSVVIHLEFIAKK